MNDQLKKYQEAIAENPGLEEVVDYMIDKIREVSIHNNEPMEESADKYFNELEKIMDTGRVQNDSGTIRPV